jgi:hypothetical protein
MTAIAPDLRAVLGGIADVLIPAAQGMPSATEAGVPDALLDEVVRARPDLTAPLVEVLTAVAADDAATAVARLRAGAVPGFDTVAVVVAGGYLMSPRVMAELGYPGQEAKIVDPDDVIRTLHDGLLDPVIERGPIYRPTPGTGEAR